MQYHHPSPHLSHQNYPQIHRQPSKYIKNYIINYQYPLGKGNFSTVYSAINKNQQNMQYAVKLINIPILREQKIQHLIKAQIDMLKSVNHKNIITCKDIFYDQYWSYIITDYYQGGNLQNYIKKQKYTSQQEMLNYIKDIYEGLKYLQKCKIIHRDIKSANIFIKNGHAVVADLGFAKFYYQPFYDLHIGSLPFMAPQTLAKGYYCNKTDVWAFGILLYEIFHGESPFAKCLDLNQLIIKSHIPLTMANLRIDLSIQLKQLILSCLQIDVQKRPKFSQIQHTWYFKKLFNLGNVTNINNINSNNNGNNFYMKNSHIKFVTKSTINNNGNNKISNINLNNSLNLNLTQLQQAKLSFRSPLKVLSTNNNNNNNLLYNYQSYSPNIISTSQNIYTTPKILTKSKIQQNIQNIPKQFQIKSPKFSRINKLKQDIKRKKQQYGIISVIYGENQLKKSTFISQKQQQQQENSKISYNTLKVQQKQKQISISSLYRYNSLQSLQSSYVFNENDQDILDKSSYKILKDKQIYIQKSMQVQKQKQNKKTLTKCQSVDDIIRRIKNIQKKIKMEYKLDQNFRPKKEKDNKINIYSKNYKYNYKQNTIQYVKNTENERQLNKIQIQNSVQV